MRRLLFPFFLLAALLVAPLACPVTALAAAAYTPIVPDGVTFESDLVYGKIGTRELHLDMARPTRVAPGTKLPVLVHIHGGGWSGGDYHTDAVLALARRGYLAVSVEYRLSGEAKWPAQINDCKGAIRWLRANADKYAIDTDRIGVWGESAGGHLSALVATSGDVKELAGPLNPGPSDKVACCLDMFGPISFDPSTSKDWSPALISGPQSPIEALLGKPVSDAGKMLPELSPLTYLDKNDPPVLILHGTKDPLVPISQSRLFYDALKKAGVEATFVPVEGAGHGTPEFFRPPVLTQVLAFLDGHLKPIAPTP